MPLRRLRVSNIRPKSIALTSAFAAIAFLAAPTLPANAADPTADLATTITAQGTTHLGGGIGYTITVTNDGPDAASNVVMTDQIPRSMWSRYPTTFLCVGSVAPPGTPWCSLPLPPEVSCITPPVGSTGTVTCSTSSLAPGASMRIFMAIRAGAYLPHQLAIDTATAASTTTDPNPANNTASAGVSDHFA